MRREQGEALGYVEGTLETLAHLPRTDRTMIVLPNCPSVIDAVPADVRTRAQVSTRAGDG